MKNGTLPKKKNLGSQKLKRFQIIKIWGSIQRKSKDKTRFA